MCTGSSHSFVEPDAAVSNQATKELEGEIGSVSQAPENQRVAMPTARASELPVLIVSGADSPRSRIGRGLESIGGMTAETLQRISTAVGGVVKSPVVLMSKVGGLASPRAATLPAPPGSSLEERVYHLEIQMKSLGEKFNSMTVVTELDLSMRSHKEKPRISRSLLQEMETDKMLEKRVQMLEDCVNERMERLEKSLSSIQSRLDYIESSKHERMAGYKGQESLSGEPQYYDAEQQSDNFEAFEAVEQNFLGGHNVLGKAIGGSPTFEKSRVKETSSIAPSIAKHVEPLQEIDTGKSDDFLEPQTVSTPVYSKEAFLMQPMKSATPSSKPIESVHRDDVGNLSAFSDQQLASTLEELHESFVMESSASTASAKFLEIARAVTAEKNTLAHASLESQSTFVSKEPQEAFLEEPSENLLVHEPASKFKEHVQEDTVGKNGTTVVATKLPLPLTFEATQNDFTKELLVATPNVEPTQEVVIIALPSSELPTTSIFVEEPMVVVPSANSKELSQEDTSDKSVTTTIARESPKACTFKDLQEDFVKESLASEPGIGLAQESSLQKDLSITSDKVLASFESPLESKSMEEPSIDISSTNHEELVQEEDVGKSENMIVVVKLPLASSLDESQEESVNELMAVVSSAKSAQVLEAKEDNDMQITTPRSKMASKFIEEPSSIVPSVNCKGPAQEDVDKTGTLTVGLTTAKSSLASSLKEPNEGFEKDSMTSTPNSKLAQEQSGMTITSSKTKDASKFVEEASVAIPSANLGEHKHEVDADKSGTIIGGAESSLVSSFDDLDKDFEKESSTLTTHESTMKSKFAEDPSTTVVNANFKEPIHEDANKNVIMTTTTELPFPTSHGGLHEDFEKESLATILSVGPIHEPSSQEGLGAISDKALASSELQVASKFVEEPLSILPSANFGELVQEDGIVKSNIMNASVKSLLTSSFEEPQKDFEKESTVALSSIEPIQELETQEESDMAPTSFESKVAFKFVEEPSVVISRAGFEESTHEDVANKSVIMTDVEEEPQEDFEKESTVALSSIEPTQKLETQEESDMVPTSSESKVASKFVEEPSVVISRAGFEESTHEDVANKSVIMTDVEEEPQEDFEKESTVALPSIEPTQKLETQEESDMVPTSSESKVASKFVEEPLVVVSRAGFEEPIHKDVANKSVIMTAVEEDPQEDFVKESFIAPPNARPTRKLSSQEDMDATSDMAFASSAPHLASKFVEKPLLAIMSANSEEPTHDKDVVINDTISGGVDSPLASSPLASSFKKSHEDFEKESLAVISSYKFAQKLVMEEDSHMAPTSSESQEASKSIEEPSVVIPNANFEELTHEDAIDKSVAMITVGGPPFAPSFEGSQKDFEKKPIVAALNFEPTQELTTQEDSDMVPFEPQVASKFVEEPWATNVPIAKFEEAIYEDIINKSGSETTTIESPSMSSSEVYKKDYMKDSLTTGPSVKVLESTKEDESGKSPIVFAPLEFPSSSFFEIPQEVSSEKPLETSIQPKELVKEKSGIVLPNGESTLTSTMEEDNYEVQEAEYKLAEDFKIHHGHIKCIEKEFPRSQSNFAHIGSNESSAKEDSDDHLESDQSGEEFFDAEHGSGNFEPWEFNEPKSFEEFGKGCDEPKEINAIAQKATLVSASSVKRVQEPNKTPIQELVQEPEQTHVQELEQELDQTPTQELEQDHEIVEQAYVQEHKQQSTQEQERHAYGQQPVQELEQHPKRWHTQEHGQEIGQEYRQATAEVPRQEPTQVVEQQSTQESTQEFGHKFEQQFAQEPEQDLTRNSAMALPPSKPQITSKFGESSESFAKEFATIPNTKFEEPLQMNAIDEGGIYDLSLTSTTEEPKIDTVVSPKKSPSSASFHQSGNPEILENLEHKSLDIPSTSSTPQEAYNREPLISTPTTEIVYGHEVGNTGATLASSESQMTPTLEEPQKDFMKEPLADAESTSKSLDLDESLADKPSVVTTSTKLARESVDKINVGLVEESPLTSIAEEPQNGSTSSLVEGKHGHDEANQKFSKDVKIIDELIEEAIPRTQSDLTHVKLNLQAIEDTTKLQSQGSFLAFGAMSMESKKDLMKETLPSAKLLELFEEENDSGKRGPILADSPMTPTIEEPQKPLPKELLELSAKSIPKSHARRRGFARSSSEPQFAYKLEEHRKVLAKESSVVVVPSASKLGEEDAQEDFGDMQCLPFRILGEGKHPRKESEFKLVEDVKSPTIKSETISSPYVLEPKPSKIKEKKKKEKKERKPDATMVEKEKRLSLRLGEIERKSSLRVEENDSKYSPRAKEKHKQPFRHLRDRLRHAFSVNKEP